VQRTAFWIKYGAGKDPRIEKYGLVPSAPTSALWCQFPLNVAGDKLNGPGEYAIRARVAGTPWTAYRSFTVGEPYITKTKQRSTGQARPKSLRGRAHSKTRGPSKTRSQSKPRTRSKQRRP